MRFLHVADLHLGKRVHQFSMLEDQRYILARITALALEHQVDGLLVAGDVYDRPVPPVEAVELLDELLTTLSGGGVGVYLVSGNHDSAERLSYGSRMLSRSRVHIAGAYEGALYCHRLEDAYGPLNLYLMPFLRPGAVARALGVQAATYQQAVEQVLSAAAVEPRERNLLVAHQFITCGGNPPETSDSEVRQLGGVEGVAGELFDAFDYVALGHIHKPQPMGRQTLRYSGSPLKYSFSEVGRAKEALLVELGPKGQVCVEALPLQPLRDLYHWQGALKALQQNPPYGQMPRDSYMHITLTDKEEMVDAIGKVRALYPNVMLLDFAARALGEGAASGSLTSLEVERKTALELFEGFYQLQNGQEMTPAQRAAFRQAAGAEGEVAL